MLDVCIELDHHELGILVPGLSEPGQLGWDDTAQWHPHALRWFELELICRAADGERYPGTALALLCRFAAVFEDDDVDAATAAVDAAYASLRPAGWTGYWPTAADWPARADLRGQNVTWYTNDAGRRWARQTGDNDADFCSLRQGSDKFPHEELRTLLNEARRRAGPDDVDEDATAADRFVRSREETAIRISVRRPSGLATGRARRPPSRRHAPRQREWARVRGSV